GPRVEEFADGLTIVPGALHGATVDTYNDHRMAMGLALVGLTIPGIVIRNPACVTKTYPHFFEDLERLRWSRSYDLRPTACSAFLPGSCCLTRELTVLSIRRRISPISFKSCCALRKAAC